VHLAQILDALSTALQVIFVAPFGKISPDFNGVQLTSTIHKNRISRLEILSCPAFVIICMQSLFKYEEESGCSVGRNNSDTIRWQWSCYITEKLDW
jgi:hypothetical protein